MDISFEDLTLERGNKRVTWEWIGEGWSGDHDETDPDDTPLLRFSCSEFVRSMENRPAGFEKEWQALDDASYCTRMPVTSNIADLVRGAAIILEAIEQDRSFKKRLEELSWLCPEDFKS
jgi:hypothetical protein